MKIHVLHALKDNFIFVLEASGRAVVIDPGEALPVQNFLRERNLKLTHILCTHHHHDHIGGVMELLQGLGDSGHGVEVFCHESDLPRVPGTTRGLSDSEAFALLGLDFRVLHIPGHTHGQIAYYFEGHVFVGDTLFSCGCGRLFEGTPEQMWSSMQRLKGLPPETQVFFGHEYTLRNIEFLETHLDSLNISELEKYRAQVEARLAASRPSVPTTIAQELKVNPFLTAPDAGTFAKWRNLRNTW